MRLVAYNVSGGLDPGAVGDVLAAIRPDVACLTEVPGGGRMRTLARSAGMDVVARTGRRGAGTAILADAAVRVRATSQVPLTTPRNVPTREATHAILGVGGLGVSVTAVQFGLWPEVRRMNLDELLAFLATIDLPSIIGCDLNESVRSPVAGAFASRYQDAHAVAGSGAGATYPTSDPSTRQDFVFVDPGLEVSASWVPTEAPVDVASHHRPVIAEVAMAADVSPPVTGSAA
jgi:endonuclease/exonuclease/phosphatase family metal-dependent hydrolase